MGFTVATVVPWGRSLLEYRAMLALTDDDFKLRILGCGDGPASFNAEATILGSEVISADPLYGFETEQIERRIEDTFETVMAEIGRNVDDFVWTSHRSPEALGQARTAAMSDFLADYGLGRKDGRYVDASLPTLPFPDGAFDLALCSHFLFLYSEQLSGSFHAEAIKEMARVAAEVRVFPLVELGNAPSRHLGTVIDGLIESGFEATVERVDYEFQRGGNQMLRVRSGSS
jgi:hypothetical protein